MNKRIKKKRMHIIELENKLTIANKRAKEYQAHWHVATEANKYLRDEKEEARGESKRLLKDIKAVTERLEFESARLRIQRKENERLQDFYNKEIEQLQTKLFDKLHRNSELEESNKSILNKICSKIRLK